MLALLFAVLLTATCATSAAVNTSSRSQPEVTLPSLGSLRGTSSSSFFTKRPIYQFLGISYANPPTNQYRFQPPVKFGPWTGLYNATRMRQRCPQIDLLYYPSLPANEIDEKPDKEDCLALNVFTPKIPNESDALLPVLFYIHGGSFYLGSAYDFKAEFLLEKDLVLVVPQYRLGPLGFATLQTDSIPGNAGMLDVILALEWVQENIIYFGGDPGRVTIVGQSAGGAAVSSLLISPLLPEGSVAQAIMQSGSIKATWAVTGDLSVVATKKIAGFCQCNTLNDDEISDCLKKTPVESLLQAHGQFLEQAVTTRDASSPTAIVIQKAGKKKFLSESPSELFRKGSFLKIPIMGGFTRDDGSAFIVGNKTELFSQKRKEPAEYFRRNFTVDVLEFMGNHDLQDGIIDFYQNKYFGSVNNIEQAIPIMIDLFGSLLLKAPTLSVIRNMREFRPSYLYSFNYAGNVSKLGASDPTWDETYPFGRGVAHSDELGYLFPMANHEYTAEELRMVKIMVELWSSFVITGKPSTSTGVPNWQPMKNEYGPYLRINKKPELRNNVFAEFEVNQLEGLISSGTFQAFVTSPLLISALALFQFSQVLQWNLG